jgi:hypothetical protein
LFPCILAKKLKAYLATHKGGKCLELEKLKDPEQTIARLHAGYPCALDHWWTWIF